MAVTDVERRGRRGLANAIYHGVMGWSRDAGLKENRNAGESDFIWEGREGTTH